MDRDYAFKRNTTNHTQVLSNHPKHLFRQLTDWTCQVACIRTMLSGFLDNVPSEKYFIDKYNLMPSPYYSKDIKRLGILKDYDTVYGCDKHAEQFDTVLDYLKAGYFVMVEGMLNYAHWVVLMGFYPNSSSDVDDAQVLVYDPYYDKVRLLIFDEFINMWCDGDHDKNNVIHDFIAVKAKV